MDKNIIIEKCMLDALNCDAEITVKMSATLYRAFDEFCRDRIKAETRAEREWF